MKILIILSLFISLAGSFLSQKSEDFIPKDASTVFSLNNISLLQKVSLDDLVKYEFMAEIHQELFDGSTSGKTLKESGIDFDQKLNIFYGQSKEFEVSGFTFGIKDKAQLFTVFDDFDKRDSPFESVELYTSYFNNLIISGQVGVLIRVDAVEQAVIIKTDSIWRSRGNLYIPTNYYEDFDFRETDLEEEIYDVEEEIEAIEDDENDFIDQDSDLDRKNYLELKDSVMFAMQDNKMNDLFVDLFVNGKNLKKADNKFAAQLTHNSEGIFYLDNSRNLQKSQGLWQLESMFPALLNDIQNLYMGNKIVGDLYLKENSIEIDFTANYGENLGSIYKELNSSKFDKKVLQYIHKDNLAYFTYNVNLRQAYEKTFEIVMPMLRAEESPQLAINVLLVDLLNEFVNKDALFGTYKGSMFGTYNGIKKVHVTKIEYQYDEDFNYSEVEVKSLEDMPVFTVGFSTVRHDIPEKILTQIGKMNSDILNLGDYWKIENALFESVPLYIINKNGLFILTNDDQLIEDHLNGYGKDKLSKADIKKTKKSGFMYAQIDWASTIDEFPKEIFTKKQNEVLDAMRGKTGNMVLTSSKTTIESTNFKLKYDFEGEYSNAGQYILDIVNSLYVITK